jgi:hypothetical protein
VARVDGFLEGRKVASELAEVTLEAVEVVDSRSSSRGGLGSG